MELSYTSIIHYLKEELHMTFRRVSSRPVLENQDYIELLKIVFCIEFSNIWQPDQVYVNIDEVTFSKSTRINYSWALKNTSNNSANISFKGSLNLIGAITSRGDWFFSTLNKINNSKTFTEYVTHLYRWLTEDLEIEPHRLVIILDNSPVHTSNKSLVWLNNLGCKVIFLSPYSPEFAPIERFFNVLKKRWATHTKGQVIDLKQSKGTQTIKECLSTITPGEVVSFWKTALKEVNNILI